MKNDKISQQSISRQGFTLVEVMVVLSILAILVTIALPSMRQFVVRSKIANVTNELVGSINFARSEAIRRSQPVTICPRSTPSSTTCPTTASQFWNNGWVICRDLNANNRCSGTDGPPIRVRDSIAGNFEIVSSAGFIRFNADGTLSGLGAARLQVTSPDSGDLALERTVCVARTGRARVVDYSGANQVCS
jgi:type IV fimbrial biogenesis protein FimT